MDFTSILPVDCISHIISLTSPRDACRSSAVSSAFKSAADSDSVWEKFLPRDYENIISNSVSASSLLATSLSKKELHFRLCHNHILVNDGTMSFALEKESGKICYMVGAGALSIAGGRFSKVAKLRFVTCLQIEGRIVTKLLSPKTTYAAYFVFKLEEERKRICEVLSVKFVGTESSRTNVVLLDPPADRPRLSRYRGDGWIEIEMGEIHYEKRDDGWLECRVQGFDNSPVGGLFVEGIEFRPKIVEQNCVVSTA